MKNTFVLAAFAIAISIACLLLMDLLASNRSDSNQIEQSRRNALASSLYANLATLPASPGKSEITRTLYEFVTEHDQAIGATLLDGNGHLIAQLGGGNDALSEHFSGSNTAKIPIKNNGKRYGHVVLAFKYPGTRFGTVIYYVLLGVLSIVLASLLCGLMAAHSRVAVD